MKQVKIVFYIIRILIWCSVILIIYFNPVLWWALVMFMILRWDINIDGELQALRQYQPPKPPEQ